MKPILAITTAVLTACAFHASAQSTILEQWKYDEDTAGLGLDQVANTGTVGTPWNYGDPTKWATDGAGYLEVFPDTGTDFKTSQTFTALADAGTYSMEIKIGEWDIPDEAVESTVKWRLRSEASGAGIMEIQTKMDSTGLSFTLVCGESNYRNYNAGEMFGTDASARIDFNIPDGTATYFVNGTEEESFSGLSFGDMEQFGMNKEGDWSDDTKYLTIDEQSLSVAAPPTPPTIIVVEQWLYEEDADTALQECANSGTVGTAWQPEDIAKFATDGDGNLDVIPGTKAYKGSNTFPALSGGDTYSLEIKIAEWDIWDTSPDRAKLQFRMNPSPSVIEIQTLLDPVEGFGFTFVCAGTNYRTHWISTMSGTDAVARIDFNIDEGWAAYFIDDVEMNRFSGLTFEPMTQFLMQKTNYEEGQIDPNTILKIDEQTLSLASTSTALGPLAIELQNGDAILTWPGAGVLQSDDDLEGAWTDIDDGAATSPYTVNGPLSGKEFYRLRP